MRNVLSCGAGLAAVCGLALSASAFGQSADGAVRGGATAAIPEGVVIDQGPYVPWVGPAGVTRTIEQIQAADAELAASGFVPKSKPSFAALQNRRKAESAGLGPVANWSASGPVGPAVVPSTWNSSGVLAPSVSDAPQTLGLNFTAVTTPDTNAFPPDSMGAVGPSNIVVMVNGRVRAFNKTTGALQTLNTTLNGFFSPAGIGSGTTDPQVRFDKATGRWIASCITVDFPNRVLLAVSASADPNGSWTFFGFQQDQATPTGDAGLLADYPSLGYDTAGIYIGANMFNTVTLVNTTVWVINKAALLSGSLQVTAFRNLWTGAVGFNAPRGVSNEDPSITTGFVIGADWFVFSKLTYRAIFNAGSAPSIGANQTLTVPTTAFAINVPQSGSSTALDPNDDRLFQAKIRRNRISGVSTLWTAHNVGVNSSGVASSATRSGVRWYQLGISGSTLNLVQSGTLFDTAATSPLFYWTGTVVMSGQGHMALGCSRSSSTTFAGAATAGRLSSDAAGSIQAPALIVAGAGPYAPANAGGNPTRWGDYSHTVVDPSDDQTMWTFQEFAAGTNVYGVRATKLIAPPPATISAATPSSIAAGQSSVSVTLTGTVVNGSGFYDTEPGFNRMVVSSTTPGVAVTSATFVSPTQLSLVLSTVGAAAGPVAITVTNPDGQSVSGSVLTVSAACYANCDSSTVPPVLNAGDFTCFLTRFTAAQTLPVTAQITDYANCDGSTIAPTLNAGDFVCFLSRFRAGCP